MPVEGQHILSELDFGAGVDISEQVFEQLRRDLERAPLSLESPLAGFQPNADEFQQQVIFAGDRTIRMLAPAGSGKTQTVVNRVLRLARDGLRPERVLVLTFDNSAAISLRDTFQKAVAEQNIPSVATKVTTLNAYGYEILRTWFPGEYKPVVRKERQRAFVKELLEQLEKKSPDHFRALPQNLRRSFYLELFSLFKNSLFDPRSLDPQRFADYLISAPAVQPFFVDLPDRRALVRVIEALNWLFRGYEMLLQGEQALDFDDQKLRAYVAVEGAPDVRRRVQHGFSEVIVDEFQDINRLDFELVKLLAAEAVLLVTGDDDQSIYGFRGCSPEFIIELEKRLGRPVRSFELRTNYRCPRNVVALADRLIRNNTYRIPKDPIAKRTDDAAVRVVAAQSPALEAKLIATTIMRLKRSGQGLSFSDFCVLYRTNAQSLPLQIEFLLTSIPFQVREADNILNSEVLERLIGVLRAKAALDAQQQPHPREAACIVRAYFRYVSPRDAGRLERSFRDAPFWDAIRSDEVSKVLPKAERSRLDEGVADLVAANGLVKALDVLARFNGLHGMIGSLEDVLDEQVPLGEIYSLALAFRGTIADFAEMLSSAVERARQQKTADGSVQGQVALSTYFRAKGRQWHTVILATCNEGLIPHKRSPVEEERRLMYVALTRTSANLIVSYVKKMCKTKVEASRFLYEAGILS